jgi:hypothetical protein
MTHPHTRCFRRLHRTGWLPVLGLALLALVGCEKDEIRTYTVDRVQRSSTVRLVAAIIPHGEEMWFFKLLGRSDAVDEYNGGFVDFVRSVRFPDKGGRPIEWKVPEGWAKEGPAEMRYATFHPAGKGRPPELTVFRLPRSPVLQNVNRWRELDLGLPNLTQKELAGVTQTFVLEDGNTKVTVVDMAGPGPRKGRGGPRPVRGPLTYRAPKGWTSTGARMGVVASFRVAEGDQGVVVTISELGANPGPLLDNVNRWRGQVGLKPLSPDEFRKETIPTVEVGRATGKYVDLTGPERRRMLVAFVTHGGSTWFFKMLGPAEAVGKHKAEFEGFLKSVKFNGGTGAADE